MTSLFSGERVEKSYLRVEAYGDVDELNSVLGALIAVLPDGGPELTNEIEKVQSDLFHVGAWLSTSPESQSLSALEEITQDHVKVLENGIDRMDRELPTLGGFILPGGHISAAWAHVARTICRRAERHVVRLSAEPGESKRPERLRDVIAYLNRLSDYLFTLARYCNRLYGVPDTLWNR